MNNPPHFKGFIPIGLTEENHPVVINFEEYESIRLSDFELMGQVEAALIMGISRPTYTRIYESARRKVAEAFVLGKTIIFEGGKVYFDSEWYSCNSCGCWFNHTEKEQILTNCSLCGSTKIEQYVGNSPIEAPEYVCICPECGKEQICLQGTPCTDEFCPSCGSKMNQKIDSQGQIRKSQNCIQ